MPHRPRPNEAELEILNLLWRRGAMTAKAIAAILSLPISTSARTRLLRDMQDKGFIERESLPAGISYFAVVDEDQVKNSLIELLLEKLFDNSTRVLVLHALRHAHLDDDDLAEIRAALGDMDRRTKEPKPPRQPGLAPN